MRHQPNAIALDVNKCDHWFDSPVLLTAARAGRMLDGVECPACGHGNRAHAKFCEECAAPLARVRADVPSPTPADLADKTRRQRPSQGERRTVTVLFVDAVGSTPLAEKL